MIDRIRILQVFGSLDMGGAESRMRDVYRYIDRSKYSFDFVTMQSEGYYEQEIRALGGDILRVESPRICGFVEHIRQLRLCMRNKNYQAVHAHTLHHCGLVMLAAWLEGIPVRIAHSRSTATRHKNLSAKLFVIIGRILIKLFATKRLAVSPEAGAFLFGRNAFEVLYDAIEVNKYQLTSPDLALKLRREMNIPDEAFVIGQIGRFESMKNHSFTLKWFANYHKKCPEAFLMLVGDGSLRNEMQIMSDKLGIADKVLFTGVRGDVPEILHLFNVHILPSTYEGLSNVVLEAQAAVIPSVISDNVSESVDLDLGLVTYVSLDAPLEIWDKAIERKFPARTYDEINKTFSERGFTIEHEISRLLAVYREGN